LGRGPGRVGETLTATQALLKREHGAVQAMRPGKNVKGSGESCVGDQRAVGSCSFFSG
jgi:hypothetical protein